MLSRRQRLSTREFGRAFEKGRLLRHPLLQLRFYRRDAQDESTLRPPAAVRAAFVAPKKLGKAVLRNRVRRRLCEQFRRQGQVGSGKRLAGCDLIFIAGEKAVTARPEELEAALQQLLGRVPG